ncbi:von Willebrand factor C domain-containing protein 2 [Biomphalaria glabrata]|nr:von Willebrand factor C domain-containing protein 2 [Biomphalaria glabrata]
MSSAGIVELILLAATFCLAQNERNCVLSTGEVLRDGERSGNSCAPCRCVHGFLQCVSIRCGQPPCMDSAILPGQCCPTCPNGPNCALPGGGILAAGRSTTLSDGLICRCSARPYGLTLANCRFPRQG